MTFISFWFHLYPDVHKPIGGVKQVHRVAESLASLDQRATIIQKSASFHPGWFRSNVNTIDLHSWNNSSFNPQDNYCVFAETFVLHAHKLSRKLPVIIFNQNFSYTFGLPEYPLPPDKVLDVYRSSSVSQVWCVSKNDLDSLLLLGCDPNKLFLLVNGFDISPIGEHLQKKKQICYMPRKNTRDSLIIINILKAQPLFSEWSFIAIENCNHQDVLSIMRESLIYLSFGHPEGFGLPVAEAMASGCAVIGYSGLGGRELFDLGSQVQMAWSVDVLDVLGFYRSLSECIHLFYSDKVKFVKRARFLSDSIINLYSPLAMKHSLKECISRL